MQITKLHYKISGENREPRQEHARSTRGRHHSFSRHPNNIRRFHSATFTKRQPNYLLFVAFFCIIIIININLIEFSGFSLKLPRIHETFLMY